MRKSTRWIVEPDVNGNGLLGFSEHRSKKDALRKIAEWRSKGIDPAIIYIEQREVSK